MKYILITLLMLVSGSTLAYDYNQRRAPIIDVTDRYEIRTEYRYRQVCDNWRGHDRRYYQRERRYSDGRPVAGAVLGAIVGSQIGDGNGQVAATAIGAITGAAIGSRGQRDRYEREQYENHRYERDHYDDRYDRRSNCRTESYPIQVRHRYYEVRYDDRGYIRTLITDQYPRGRFIYVYN